MSNIILEEHVETLLKQRYYQDGEGWPQLCHRVAKAIVDDPFFRQEVESDLLQRIWLPNSPCLVNAGKKKSAGYFACFVAGPSQDSLETHLDTLADIAQVAKKGGGCGFTGSHIRPKNSPVAGSTHGYSYGPVAWALSVSQYLHMMTQAGFRRMALMFTLSSDHPDLDEFIDCKQKGDESVGYNFNQSVMATDDFMKAATANPQSKQHQQLRRIAANAWANGEPGLLFYDTINGNTPYVQEIVATNPCGEQPLPEYGSCNLGSINIAHSCFFDEDGSYNYKRLAEKVTTITEFLDLVGSKTEFPNEKFANWYAIHRPVGVGIMGYADALLKMGVAYGSDTALTFLEDVMRVVFDKSRETSQNLMKALGFPGYEMKPDDYQRRNICTVSIAPTGSISFIANCSSGIEPIFMPSFYRKDERGETYSFQHEDAAKPFFRSAVNDDPEKVVNHQQHLRVQTVCQAYTDSGVSKTINFPNSATIDDVYEAMVAAWEYGVKGITVYRDGSRQEQVLTKDAPTAQANKPANRPDELSGKTYRVKSPVGTVFITINELKGKPFEVFVRVGKGGSETQAFSEAIGRLISLILRTGSSIENVVEQLVDIGGSRSVGFGKKRIVSLPDAVGQTLAKHQQIVLPATEADICPECGQAALVNEEGCKKCLTCGYSEC